MNNKGFTIIEVLVALFILIAVSFAVIALVTRSDQVADRAQESFIAASVAREGVELVRAVRDTQWFTDANRSNWIIEDMCSGPFVLDAQTVRNRGPVITAGSGELFIQDNHEWTHSASNIQTKYARLLELDCRNKDADPGVVVTTARVTWESRGQMREIVLKEKLYNWLP